MSDDKSIAMEICQFLDNCPFDDYIQKLNNAEIVVDDPRYLETTILKIRIQETKLRSLRQQIEYHVRKHRLEEFRQRV